MAPSIFSRKRDFAYLIYFIIHIPVMLLVDLSSLYPPALTPGITVSLRRWYIATYKDQFFVAPPSWFVFYIWMEAFFHLPVSLWSIRGLLKDDHLVPLVLLVYALQTVITTATCIAEYASWTVIDFDTKIQLGALYGPYMAVGLFMAVDTFLRLKSVITSWQKFVATKKDR